MPPTIRISQPAFSLSSGTCPASQRPMPQTCNAVSRKQPVHHSPEANPGA
jgi:hypothetical protein